MGGKEREQVFPYVLTGEFKKRGEKRNKQKKNPTLSSLCTMRLCACLRRVWMW